LFLQRLTDDNGKALRSWLGDEAELVIEVAVSSPTLDRENASLYAEGGVKEYWIVLGPERRVEVYGLPDTGRAASLAQTTRSNVPACRRCASWSPICSLSPGDKNDGFRG